MLGGGHAPLTRGFSSSACVSFRLEWLAPEDLCEDARDGLACQLP